MKTSERSSLRPGAVHVRGVIECPTLRSLREHLALKGLPWRRTLRTRHADQAGRSFRGLSGRTSPPSARRRPPRDGRGLNRCRRRVTPRPGRRRALSATHPPARLRPGRVVRYLHPSSAPTPPDPVGRPRSFPSAAIRRQGLRSGRSASISREPPRRDAGRHTPGPGRGRASSTPLPHPSAMIAGYSSRPAQPARATRAAAARVPSDGPANPAGGRVGRATRSLAPQSVLSRRAGGVSSSRKHVTIRPHRPSIAPRRHCSKDASENSSCIGRASKSMASSTIPASASSRALAPPATRRMFCGSSIEDRIAASRCPNRITSPNAPG